MSTDYASGIVRTNSPLPQDSIVKAGMHRISTGPFEGVNTRAKLLKRITYDHRRIKCFMLKLKAAFPGRGVNPLHVLTD